jgi:NAD(P)-dependent dehydrogenase (short-subunit alcohol dehydrogenase family)
MLTEFKGKIAVITGAASGLGLAMAHRFAKEGMHLVLADFNKEALQTATSELQKYEGIEVVAVPTDVGKPESVKALATTAFERFNNVHLLINNAGISSAGPVWETTLEDWKRVFDVNFFGIVNGLQSFLGRMMQQPFPSHIVNTASAAGLLSPPGLSIYTASKHAAVALTETLYADLSIAKSPVGVSVLCPAWVKTGIAGKYDPETFSKMSPFTQKVVSSVGMALQTATVTPEDVAEATFKAVQNGEFYILTHPEVKEDFLERANRLADGKAPVLKKTGADK